MAEPEPWDEDEIREATEHALEAIYSGATFTEADALIDQLDDLGYRVVPK